jgi:haloalkane dehalogenase
MWSLKDDKHYSGPAKVVNSWLGRMMYLSLNAPVNMIMPSAFGNKKLLTPVIHSHYKNALRKGERTAAFRFAKELIDASDWWQSLWNNADTVKNKKILFFWGMRDKFIPAKELKKWQEKFPHANTIVFHDAGHFVQEEKSIEMIAAIDSLLNSNN